ncbi:MAG: iron-sulfur cluster assembly scaffold protein [Sphingomicrobium sp.]
MNAPLYTPAILRLAASLREPVRLERVDGKAEERSPTCGSSVRLEVQIDSAGRVEALSLEVQACAFGQASASLVEAGAEGRGREDVNSALEQLTAWLSGECDEPPSGWPGFEALAPARTRQSRHGAILLPLRALLAALGERPR